MNVGDNNVIVTAHPDDETLWCGGLPIFFEDRHWAVVCCSKPKADPIRAEKFFDACAVLGVMGMQLPYTEGSPDEILFGLHEIDLSNFDCIVTHNGFGEYGHPHHRYVHRVITEFWRGNGKQIFTIGFRPQGQGKLEIKLSRKQVEQKMNALKCYDHQSKYDSKPKWEALVDRYYKGFGINPAIETYDAA